MEFLFGLDMLRKHQVTSPSFDFDLLDLFQPIAKPLLSFFLCVVHYRFEGKCHDCWRRRGLSSLFARLVLYYYLNLENYEPFYVIWFQLT